MDKKTLKDVLGTRRITIEVDEKMEAHIVDADDFTEKEILHLVLGWLFTVSEETIESHEKNKECECSALPMAKACKAFVDKMIEVTTKKNVK